MHYRWQDADSYRTNAGINVVTHDLSELADLHEPI